MTEPERIDFKQIIEEIEGAGIGHYKLSVMMRRQIGWVQRVAAGQEPKHYEGQMLLMIHEEVVQKLRRITQKLADVPRETFETEPSQLHKDMMSA